MCYKYSDHYVARCDSKRAVLTAKLTAKTGDLHEQPETTTNKLACNERQQSPSQ